MLGLKDTYIQVPTEKMNRYALGYSSQDTPIRMSHGVLADEAYGVRTTASDLTHFVSENINPVGLNKDLQRDNGDSHWLFYLRSDDAGPDLGAIPANKLTQPLQLQQNVLLNKTGSTNGFGAYVVFVPYRRIGVVLLANKSYPIDARVAAARAILVRLERLPKTAR